MTANTWILLIFSVVIGIPILILLILAIRRVADLRKLGKPVGTLYIAEDRSIYSEFDMDLDDFPNKREIVLRVKRLKGKR